ncbi:hypothetical protein HY634_04090 [Candidatus Uhrbacteria bacterium]|nr:hypothetical protein [Candidatus Uhrbacteria bacterium]
MNGVLQRVYAAYVEWRGVRSSLPPRERRSFPRWMLRTHPEIASKFRDEPARFRLMCREVERGTKLPKRPSIGQRTLERHMPALADRWLALSDGERGTFPAFVSRVLAEHPTPRAIERWLRTPSNV